MRATRTPEAVIAPKIATTTTVLTRVAIAASSAVAIGAPSGVARGKRQPAAKPTLSATLCDQIRRAAPPVLLSLPRGAALKSVAMLRMNSFVAMKSSCRLAMATLQPPRRATLVGSAPGRTAGGHAQSPASVIGSRAMSIVIRISPDLG